MTVRHLRRYNTEFKIQLLQAYLDGNGSVRKIATRHRVPSTLLPIWIKKYEAAELTQEVHLQEQVGEYEARIGALERKIDQLTMELEVMKKRALIQPSKRSAQPSIISGPGRPRPTGVWPDEHGEKHVLKRPNAGNRIGRRKADVDMRVRIEDILAEFPTGYRRVTRELPRRGMVVNSQTSLACYAAARAHAPPRTRMARHDEQCSAEPHVRQELLTPSAL